MDDIGLLHLLSIDQRFEAIAQVVFKRKYAGKYFVIKGESEKDQELYRELFRVFGDGINSIEANGLGNIDKNHWMTHMLQKHAKNLDKMSFRACSFTHATGFLSQHLHITDLKFQDHKSDMHKFDLPEYRQLKKLEIRNFGYISSSSLENTIHNNPQLESLVMRFLSDFTPTEVMRVVSGHLKHLKELDVLNDTNFDGLQQDSLIDEFTDSLEDIESLAISIDTEAIELLRQLGRKCKRTFFQILFRAQF